MKKIKLEKLIEEGWEKKDHFGDCEIYANGDHRLLYNPRTEQVVLRGIYKQPCPDSSYIKTTNNIQQGNKIGSAAIEDLGGSRLATASDKASVDSYSVQKTSLGGKND